MTVEELISHLRSNYELDTVVVLSRDAEGNGYSVLDAVEGAYLESGDEVSLGRFESILLEGDLEEDDDDVESYNKIVVLWPV